MNIVSNKIAVYTAVIGNYDELFDPVVVSKGCDYICFTDADGLVSNVWQIRVVRKDINDNTRMARKIKLLPHIFLPEYRYTVWVDGNISIIGNIFEFIAEYCGGRSFVAFKHPARSCFYEEAAACIERNKDSPWTIIRQAEYYKKNSYPKRNGMIESGVLFRDSNDDGISMVMDKWWDHVFQYSKRDQLSFNYISWKSGFKYNTIDVDIRCFTDYFHLQKHKKRKENLFKSIYIKVVCGLFKWYFQKTFIQ